MKTNEVIDLLNQYSELDTFLQKFCHKLSLLDSSEFNYAGYITGIDKDREFIYVSFGDDFNKFYDLKFPLYYFNLTDEDLEQEVETQKNDKAKRMANRWEKQKEKTKVEELALLRELKARYEK